MELNPKSSANAVPESTVVSEAVASTSKVSTIIKETNLAELLDKGFAQHVNQDGILEVEPTAKEAQINSYYRIDQLMRVENFKKLKELLRKHNWLLSSWIRAKLWPEICAQHPAIRNLPTGFYNEMIDHIFGSAAPNERKTQQVGLPMYVDKTQCLSYHLTKEGINSANRIMNVLVYENPVINYCPELYPLTAILLHYMREDIAYHSIATLLNSTGKVFVNQTKLLNEVAGQTVLQMTRKYAKPMLYMLHDLCPKANLEQTFSQWNWWIFAGLPFPHLVRIIDCFLYEGIKVFYRITFVLLNMFAKEWSMVDSVVEHLLNNDVNSALIEFYRNVPITPAKLLSAAFSIRSFSTNYISKQYVIADKVVRSRHVPPVDLNNQNSAQFNLLSISHSLVLRDQVHAQTWQKMLFTLWTWMPIRISMSQPNPLYSSSNQQRSLLRVYDCMCKHAPALMIIETCTNEIFGFYNSTCWSLPDPAFDKGFLPIYNGSKDDFLYILYPKRTKYPWIDTNSQLEPSYLSKHFQPACSELIAKNERRLAGEAIWLDNSLRYGKTKCCKLYSSPALCPRGEFEIRLLQIFDFKQIDQRLISSYTEQIDLVNT